MNESMQLKIALAVAGVLLLLLLLVMLRNGSTIRKMQQARADSKGGVLNRAGFLVKLSRPSVLESGRTSVVSLQISNLLKLCRLLDAEEYQRILTEIGSTLASQLGEGAFVAKTGDDSFCFMIKGAGRDEIVMKLNVIKRALSQLRAGRSNGMLVPVFGICPCMSESDKGEDLLNRAVLARTHATPERAYRFFDAELDTAFIKDRQLLDALEQARSRGELAAYYQPRISLTERKIAGAEVLIRWHHPQRGLLSPDMFLPLSEAYGSASQLDRFSFEEACRTVARWQDEGRELCPLSVNLSADSLHFADLPKTFSEISHRYRVPSGLIELEISETIVAENTSAARTLFEKLHDCGFRCAIDRFGSGLCATRLLGSLDIDTIKFDRSFLSGVNNDRVGRYILENMFRLAAQMHAHTVAVGVDSRSQVGYLQQVGCDDAQGFLFFQPMPADRLDSAIYSNNRLKVFSAASLAEAEQRSEESAESTQPFRNIILFSYWPSEDEVEFSESFSPVLKGGTRFRNAVALFRTSSLIHENDRSDFIRILQQSQRTDGWTESTLRFCVSEQCYAWLDLRVRWERHGGSARISGMLVNMDGWRSEVNRWKEKAERDVLTGLYNREHFEKVLGERLRAGAYSSAAVLFVDVDDLKLANDHYGHLFGDSLLCYVAKQMLAVFRHTDVIARYGGDEFVVFAPDITKEVLEQRLQKLYAAFRHSFRSESILYNASVSIGVAFCPQDGKNAAALLEHADCALYEAKKQKNRYVFYERSMKTSSSQAEKRLGARGSR